MCRPAWLLGWILMGLALAGCLLEEAKQAAELIGISRYEDMVERFGPPAETDRTFTGKFRATWKSRSTNTEGRVSTDRLILVFGKDRLLKKVTYEDGADDRHLINWFSGSFTCDERGNYPGGSTWKDDRRSDLTPDTVPEPSSKGKKSSEGWKSRK
jgi:hypothetical protein